MCLDIARDAMQMYNSGATVGEIQRAIDVKYGANPSLRTPTPPPPKGQE